jgi:hypothetical protein
MAHLNSADVDRQSSPSPPQATLGLVPDAEQFHAYAHAEFEALCSALTRRLQNGALPPDEAYWWTRILFAEAVVMLDHARCEPVWSGLNPGISVDRAAA